jgi:hypothetical protein
MRSSRLVVGGSMLLLIRGVLLWLVVPLAVLLWVILAGQLRRRGVGLGRFLGWVDLNLIAFLQRTALRPFFAEPIQWISPRGMSTVTHRLRWLDLA